MSIIETRPKLPPPSEVRQSIPDGDTGAKYTLMAMKKVARDYPCKSMLASLLYRQVRIEGSDAVKIDDVYRWTNSLIRYAQDDPDWEEIKSPCRILREVAQQGFSSGDCDDIAVFIVSCFKLLRMPAAFLAVSNMRIPAGAVYPVPPQNPNQSGIFSGWFGKILDKFLGLFGFVPANTAQQFHGSVPGPDISSIPLDHVMAIVYDRQRQNWITVDPVAPGKNWDGHKWMAESV